MVHSGYPLDHLVKSTPKVLVLFGGALVESGTIAYHERHSVRFPFELDANLHQYSTDAHSTATSPSSILATIDSLTAKHTPWFPFFSYLPPSDPEPNTTCPAAVKHFVYYCASPPQYNDITTRVLGSLQYHRGVAYAVCALKNKCGNVVRTHAEFPCSRPSPCICANFVSSPSNPPASPPFLSEPPISSIPPSVFPRVFPPLRLPSPSPVLA